MKNIIELELERTAETKQYYIFRLKSVEKIPQFFPKDKIYIRKDYFTEEPVAIMLIAAAREKK